VKALIRETLVTESVPQSWQVTSIPSCLEFYARRTLRLCSLFEVEFFHRPHARVPPPGSRVP
jgi:hypothetical protein